MKRLTTDNPKGNFETLMNLAYAKDKRVFLRGVYEDGGDMELYDFISLCVRDTGCGATARELEDGICEECYCEFGYLSWVCVQAAELRGRLKMYEDADTSLEIRE